MVSRLKEYWLLYVFVGMVCVIPLIGLVTVKTVSEAENRNLAVFPAYSSQPLAEYFGAISAYLDDHFGMRDSFVSLHDMAKDKFKKKSGVRVYEGRDGWHFFTDVIDFYIGALDSSHKTKFAEGMTKLRAAVPAETPIVVVVIPNKSFVYSDYLPDWVEAKHIRAELMGILNHIDGVGVIDALDVLQNPVEPVFLKYDTHWNGVGAYKSYQYIIQQLQALGHDVPLYDGQVTLREEPDYSGDLANMLGKKGVLKETNNKTIFKDSLVQEVPKIYDGAEHKVPDYLNEGSDKTLLLLHDSFTQHGLGQHLAHSFHKTHTIWDFSFNKLLPVIQETKPDMIIVQIVDRHMLQYKFWREKAAD